MAEALGQLIALQSFNVLKEILSGYVGFTICPVGSSEFWFFFKILTGLYNGGRWGNYIWKHT